MILQDIEGDQRKMTAVIEPIITVVKGEEFIQHAYRSARNNR